MSIVVDEASNVRMYQHVTRFCPTHLQNILSWAPLSTHSSLKNGNLSAAGDERLASPNTTRGPESDTALVGDRIHKNGRSAALSLWGQLHREIIALWSMREGRTMHHREPRQTL